MANFPTYHGITLAANSYVENLVVEKLAFDPVPVEAGRIWFNTTDKVFRQSSLDGVGAVTVFTFSTLEDLTAAVATEQTRAQAAEASLASAISAETSARQAADATLTSNLNAEITRATNAESTLQANITAEATARSDADATLQSNLNAEITRATAAESTLTTNLANETTARTNADTTLQSNIDAEVTRALAAEGSLQSAINSAMTNLTWREMVLAATGDNAPAEGTALSTLLPFSDDQAPEMVIGDFAAGDLIVFKAGTASVIATLDASLNVTYVGVRALAAGDTFVVKNDLPDSPAAQEGMAMYTYDGSTIVKIGDMDWSLATGIDLSSTFVAAAGTVTAGDSVEAAISKLVANLAAANSNAAALVAAEQSRAEAAEATLTANLSAEVTRATDAESTLTSNLNAEITRATNAETTLTSNLNAEITRATDAEATLTANLSAEVTRATDAEATLTSNLNAEITRATNAETTLTTNLTNEVNRATAAESTLTSNLNAEITRATAAESTLTANLNSEITRATAAEATLTANLNAEITRATGVEGSLASLTTTDKSNLVSAINELNNSLAGGTEQVRDDYDATIYVYDSTNTTQNPGGAAATSYVITHNLASDFVDAGVWIKRLDGSYYNDIVSVKIDTNSQMTVYLSTAQHVRVICRSAATLGLIP